jgi:hypothetical protein
MYLLFPLAPVSPEAFYPGADSCFFAPSKHQQFFVFAIIF